MMWTNCFTKLKNSLNICKYAKCMREIQRRLSVGDAVEVTRVFSEDEVQAFASLTGDMNPIHLDSEVAKKTKFGRCIVHGAFLNGLVSGVIGMKLPGAGSVLIHQYIEFSAPLFVGEEVTARVEIANIKRRMVECTFFCEARSRKEIVMKGYAKLLVMTLDPKPEISSEETEPPIK